MAKKKITFISLILNMLGGVGALLTLLLGIVLFCSAYGGKIDPATTANPAYLTLGLPYLTLLTAAVAIFWLILRQWKSAAIAAVALLICASPISTVIPLNVFTPSSEEGDKELKLMSFNVKYFIYHDDEYRNETNPVYEYLMESDADVIALQEGSLSMDLPDMPSVGKEKYAELLKKYPYNTSSDKINTMALLSKYPFKEVYRDIDGTSSKTIVFYQLDVDGKELLVANTHLQSIHLNSDDKEFFMKYTAPKNIKSKLRQFDDLKAGILSKLHRAFNKRACQAERMREVIDSIGVENVIVCGDFNDTPSSYAYRAVRGDDFNDAFEDIGFGPIITYHENRFWLKIDHVLYRGALEAVDFQRNTQKISDHYPLIATFRWMEEAKNEEEKEN